MMILSDHQQFEILRLDRIHLTDQVDKAESEHCLEREMQRDHILE